MKILRINKIIALIIICSIVVTNVEINSYANFKNSYVETVNNEKESKTVVDDKNYERAEGSVIKELKDLRTTNTTTYLLSDGSRKLEINGADIRYKDGKKLKEYNPNLKKLATNNLKELKEISKEKENVLEEAKIKQYSYVNTAGDSKQYFPEILKGNLGIVLKKDEYVISLAPLIENQNGNELEDEIPCIGNEENVNDEELLNNIEESDKTSLCINNVENDNISYLNERDKVEYKYTSLSSGVKEEIVLKERPHSNIFIFNISLINLKIEKDEYSEGINIIDKKTMKEIAYIDKLNIKDQEGDVRYEEVSYEIEELEDDNYIFKIIVDSNYLNNPNIKYPVIIDPTVVWMDSYLPCTILSNDPTTADSNLKVSSYFEVQNQTITTNSGFNPEYMCFIQTSLNPTSGDIGQLHGSKIESANLKIVEYGKSSSHKSGVIEVRTPKGEWGTYTLTWNNHPEVGDRVWAQFITTGTMGKRHDVDLTSWAQAVADGEINNYGLVIKAKNKGTGAYFYGPSLQNIRYLQLSITYYPYVATVNHYYDNAYNVRYSQSKYGNNSPSVVIGQYQDWVSSVFSTLFSLKIISNTPQKYTSLADMCKLNQGLTINTSSMNQECPGGTGHGYKDKSNRLYSKCTDRYAVHKSFIEDKPGNNICCNVLWTGNQMYANGEIYNRATFWNNNIFIYDPFEPNNRIDQEKRDIMHELAHNFGAPDEYCSNENLPAGKDCGVAGCPIHHPERFIGDCIMGYAMYDSDRIFQAKNIFCEFCIEDIKKHLEKHHRVSPLVITPKNGETIGEAVSRELGITDAGTITKIKITGNAIMDSSTQYTELTNILPNLEEVDLSGFSGALGMYSFYNCSNLHTVKLPAKIELPSYAFAQCKKLNTIYKEENSVEIGKFDLSGVTALGSYTFQNTGGTVIKLPETLAISQYCFKDCANIRTIYKRNESPIDREADLSGITSLGMGAFANAGNAILSINLPKNIDIPANCFQNWKNLKKVKFDISQTTRINIETSAFDGVNESCIAYMSQILVEDDDFIIHISPTANMWKRAYPLIVKPNTGETMEQAITRELGTISEEKVKEIKLQGSAVMGAGTSNEDSAKILPELETVDLSEFTGKLGDFAFHTCTKLKTVILPKNNINLPMYAFADCSSLDTVYKSGNEPVMGECDLSGVTSAGYYALMNTAISEVKLPSTFTIPQYCFIACKNLSAIYKEGENPVAGELDLSGVTNIGFGAFWNYYGNAAKFDTVKLSEGISLGGNCFRSCSNLTTVYKKGKAKVEGEADLSGVKLFGTGTFSGLTASRAPQISKVKLPKNVAIPSECFRNCSNLKKVMFDETQSTKVLISTSAFHGVNLSCVAYMHQALVMDSSFEISLSDTVNMPKMLYKLIVKPNDGETMKQAITRELGTISEEKVKEIKLQGSAVMGAGTSNEDSAKILPELETVDLSEFTGKLGDFAFHTCTKLKTVILPKNNINLPMYAFADCSSLDTVYKSGNEPVMGECDLSGVTSAGYYALMNTAISEVKLPSTFTIPQYCFIACKNLSAIYKEGENPVAGELDLSGVTNIGFGAFWNYYGNAAKFDTVKLSEGISLGGNCFRSCSNLTTVYKKGKAKVEGEADLSGVKLFGTGTFSGLTASRAPQISKVKLPKNVAIPSECFRNCSNLKKVMFDETQSTKVLISTSAFYGVNLSCVAYMHYTLVNDISFVLPISNAVNMPKYAY